jgi:hypothetical protein
VKIGLRLGAIVLTGTFAVGCAAGGYEPAALKRDLVKTGVSAEVADCVGERMSDTFGANNLGARVEPSAEERNAQRKIIRECEKKAAPTP